MQHRRKKNKTMEHNNTQEKLLYELQVADFALHECVLYLDGHPYDRAAKEYYNKCCANEKRWNRNTKKNTDQSPIMAIPPTAGSGTMARGHGKTKPR